MKKKDLVIGRTYLVRHRSSILTVRLDDVVERKCEWFGGYRKHTYFPVTDMLTGKKMVFPSSIDFLELSSLKGPINA